MSKSSIELDDDDDPSVSPPPSPMPHVGEVDGGDGSDMLESLPAKPRTPSVADLGTIMPSPPMPPLPGGPPPKEQSANRQLLSPPPAVHKSLKSPPPGTGGLPEREKNQSAKSDNLIFQEPVQGSGMLPLPPRMPPKPPDIQSEDAPSESSTTYNHLETKELSEILPPPQTPPRQQLPIPGPSLHPALQQDVRAPIILRTPPSPPDMLPQSSTPKVFGQQAQHTPQLASMEPDQLLDPPDEYKKDVVSLIERYFSTGDVHAASSDLRELGSNDYHPYFIKRLISIALSRPDKEKEMAYVLLSALYADVITPRSICQGFLILLESADDLARDILDAVNILALFVARAAFDHILPKAFFTGAGKGFPLLTKGLLVLEAAQISYLSAQTNAELFKQTWGGSTHVTDEEMKTRISDLLRKYVETGDTSEARECIRQLGAAYFHHEIVKKALILAMETRTAEPAILELLKEAAETGLVSSSQMLKGFSQLADNLDDLIALDTQSAETLFQSVVFQATSEGWLDDSFLKSSENTREIHEKDSEKLKVYKVDEKQVDERLECRDALVVAREETLGTELSPTSYLGKFLEGFRGDAMCKSESQFKDVLKVYMNFVKARERPGLNCLNVESSKALGCYVQGMSELGPDNQQVHEFLAEIMPTKDERQKRMELIERLTKYITEKWPYAKVVSYGSFGSGLSLKSSNIDLTIFKNGLFKDENDVWTMLVDSEYVEAETNKFSTAEFLSPICELMCSKGMLKVELIDAKVPIVRCVDPKDEIEVDLSLYGIDGFLNTKLLSCIQTFDQRIPNLITLVKNWAKVSKLNKAKDGCLSSYSYNLMVVNFCQMRGVALVLHHATKKTFKVKIGENIFGFCEHNRGDMANKANANDRLTLYELLKAFFRYWDQEYNYYDDVVSVRTGKTISRRESRCSGELNSRSRIEKIIIEHPFQIDRNVCCSLKSDQLQNLRKEFETSARLLEMGAKNWIDRYRPGGYKY